MKYRVETETLEGEKIRQSAATLPLARVMARQLSRKHFTAYVVAVDNDIPVGHIAFGEGRQTEVLGVTEP